MTNMINDDIDITVKVHDDASSKYNRIADSIGSNNKKISQSYSDASKSIQKFNADISKPIATGLNPAALGLNTKALQQMGMEMERTKGKTEGLNKSTNSLFGSMKSGSAGALMGIAAMGAGVAMFYQQAITMAAGSEQVWERLTVTLGKSGFEVGAVRQEYSGMVQSIMEDTGRMKGDIVTTLGSLSRVGVQNKEIMQESTEAIAALAFIKLPGDPQGFNTIAEGWTNIINKPKLMTRSLATLGIDTAKFDGVLKAHNLTMGDWGRLTTEQRSNLLSETVALQNGEKANEAYKESYEGLMNQITQSYKTFMTTVGNELLPTIKDIAKWAIPMLQGLVSAFQGLSPPMKQLIVLSPLLIAGLAGIGALALTLKPVYDMLTGIGDKFKGLGGKKKIDLDCNPCPDGSQLGGAGGKGGKKGSTATTGGFTGMGTVGTIALAATAVYLAADAIDAGMYGQEIYGKTGGDWGASIFGGLSRFSSNLPLPLIIGKLLGKEGPTTDQSIDSWNKLKGGAFGGIGGLFSSIQLGFGGLGGTFKLAEIIGPKIPQFKWPPLVDGGIYKYVKEKIPWLKFPNITLGSVTSFIKDKITWLAWQIPGVGSILGIINPRVGFLSWPGVGTIGSWIYNLISGRIGGYLNFSSIMQIGANAIQQAVNAHKGPAGPGTTTTLANASGTFTYKGYAGMQQSIGETLSCNSGNCVDGSLAQIALASSYGIPSELIYTTWNGNPHVAARIGGQVRDISHRALTGDWGLPPAGPGNGPYQTSNNNQNVTVNINAPVYGVEDLQRAIKSALNNVTRHTVLY